MEGGWECAGHSLCWHHRSSNPARVLGWGGVVQAWLHACCRTAARLARGCKHAVRQHGLSFKPACSKPLPAGVAPLPGPTPPCRALNGGLQQPGAAGEACLRWRRAQPSPAPHALTPRPPLRPPAACLPVCRGHPHQLCGALRPPCRAAATLLLPCRPLLLLLCPLPCAGVSAGQEQGGLAGLQGHQRGGGRRAGGLQAQRQPVPGQAGAGAGDRGGGGGARPGPEPKPGRFWQCVCMCVRACMGACAGGGGQVVWGRGREAACAFGRCGCGCVVGGGGGGTKEATAWETPSDI